MGNVVGLYIALPVGFFFFSVQCPLVCHRGASPRHGYLRMTVMQGVWSCVGRIQTRFDPFYSPSPWVISKCFDIYLLSAPAIYPLLTGIRRQVLSR